MFVFLDNGITFSFLIEICDLLYISMMTRNKLIAVYSNMQNWRFLKNNIYRSNNIYSKFSNKHQSEKLVDVLNYTTKTISVCNCPNRNNLYIKNGSKLFP